MTRNWMAGVIYRQAGLLLRTALFLITCVVSSNTISSAFAQPLQPGQPRLESVNLRDAYFARRINNGSIVLGVIEELNVVDEPRFRRQRLSIEEFNINIKVERTILGATPDDAVVINPSHCLITMNWKRMLGEDRLPVVGDRVFYQYLPSDLSGGVYPVGGGPVLGPANEEDLSRLDRVVGILGADNTVLAAESVLAGCFDQDFRFAEWCLLVSDTRDQYAGEPYRTAYGKVRDEISTSQNLETCWKLLEEPGTHSRVYEWADSRLAREPLNEAEQNRRHRRNAQRIHSILHDPPTSKDDHFYREAELRYLMTTAYPKMPQKYHLELIEQLKESVRDRRVSFRHNAIAFVSYLYDPGDEQSHRAVYDFYLDSLPRPAEPEGVHYSFAAGLERVMKAESKHTQSISTSGLNMLQSVIIFGEEKWANEAISPLERYAGFCQREEIAWPELPHLLTSLIVATPHPKVKARLKLIAEGLEISIEDVPEAL